MTETYTYLPPANAEIEAALLGAILTNAKALDKVTDILRPEHFWEPVHGEIYAACCELQDQGKTPTPLVLKHFFDHVDALEKVGGGQYLFDLAASVVTIVNVEDYAESIIDLWLRRQIFYLGEDMKRESSEPMLGDPGLDQLNRIELKLLDLYPESTREGPAPAATFLRGAYEKTEDAYKRSFDKQLSGVPTGLMSLDERLGGLHPGELVILAGRPSMGKSALAKTIALNAARAAVPGGEGCHHVLFFSAEMDRDSLGQTMLSTLTGIPAIDMRKGTLTAADIERLVKASIEFGHMPLSIDDAAGAPITYMRSVARRMARKQPLHLIVIDYLQRLAVDQSGFNRAAQFGDIAKGGKTMARELGVPVLMLSQLSRGVEQREDHRPQLGDLRESGDIEQEADVAILLYREEYYLERAEPVQRDREDDEAYAQRRSKWHERLEASRNKADAIIAKQRYGPTGTVKLRFDGPHTCFVNAPEDEAEAEQQEMMEGLV